MIRATQIRGKPVLSLTREDVLAYESDGSCHVKEMPGMDARVGDIECIATS